MGLGVIGKYVLHQHKGLRYVDFADVARDKLAQVGDSTWGQPVIDVDFNNFFHINSHNSADPVSNTANALEQEK